jgi:hypothetical protein
MIPLYKADFSKILPINRFYNLNNQFIKSIKQSGKLFDLYTTILYFSLKIITKMYDNQGE